MSAANGETEYQRAWRERGEAEQAFRQWQHSRQSPAFIKGVGVLGAIMGGLLICAAIKNWSAASIPIIFLGLLFASMAFTGPVVIRDQAKRRAEAEATLKRLKVWK